MEPCCHRFTGAEGGARLAATASEQNTLVTECGDFISTRLLHEEAYNIRGSLSSGKQRSVRITLAPHVKPDAYELRILTDLKVTEAVEYDDVECWSQELETQEVIVCTSKVLKKILEDGFLKMTQINVLVIDSCHLIYRDENLRYIMKIYKQTDEETRPRILAITYPLFSSNKVDKESNSIENETDSIEKATNTVEKKTNSLEKETNSNEIEVNSNENSKTIDILKKETTENDTLNTEMSIDAQNVDKTTELSATDDKSEENAELKDIDNKNELSNTTDEKSDNETMELNVTDKIIEITDVEEPNLENKDTELEPIDNLKEISSIDMKNIDDDSAKTIDSKEIKTTKDNFFNELCVYENYDDFEMYEKLEWKIDELEKELCCKMDLAEDIDGCKRLAGPVPKPKELIIEYKDRPPNEELIDEYILLEEFMKDNVFEVLDFLYDHRHDPTEIYGDELYEELKSIPDPTVEPIQIFKEFLYVLDELGPYAADKAAFSLLIKLEKLKIKVPYERHFLLLRLCTTVLVKIRCYAETFFENFESDWDKIRLFSTPKLLRLVDILEKFTPEAATPDANSDNKLATSDNKVATSDNKVANPDNRIKKEKLLNEIDNCDFTTLGDKIEDKLNVIEANLKELNIENTNSNKDKEVLNPRPRVRRGRPPRSRPAPHNPHALCAIVFLRHAYVAKILFCVIADLTRVNPNLSYITCQYCAVEPTSEQKESQKQGKRHEEVLKKFRMHECNLLLTTSALEEGIDLPRCNLVLRWDLPPSYRSYVLSRSRGRAARATHVLLCKTGDHITQPLLHHAATYTELDQVISRKCGCGIQDEPTADEESHADSYNSIIKPYTPNEGKRCRCDQNNKNIESLTSDLTNLTVNSNKECIYSDKDLAYLDKEHVYSDNDHVNSDKKPINSDKQPSLHEGNTKKGVNSDKECMLIEKHKDTDKENGNSNKDKVNTDKEKLNSNENYLESNYSDDSNKLSVNTNNDDKYLNKEPVYSDEERVYSDKERVYSKENPVLNLNVKNDSVNQKTLGDKSEDCAVNDEICPNCCEKKVENVVSVDLNSAIALINRYCAKLPSDTFTRLAPQYWLENISLPSGQQAFVCTLRLPLNCPVKYNIVGHPMPSGVLARRVVALQACRILHRSGELDDHLMPIGKENFKAAELESATVYDPTDLEDAARPGTTKRRQYYYKRTAHAFTDCQPVVDTTDAEIDRCPIKDTEESKDGDNIEDKRQDDNCRKNRLYLLSCSLWCGLPERYNTRGRRLHTPQHAPHALAVLMYTKEDDRLQIPAFPVYTRSGEVRVSVERAPHADVRLSPRRGRLIRRFMRFVFDEVLRVRRRGMKLQTEGSTKNNYYVVPTIKSMNLDGETVVDIDWSFLELIYQHSEEKKLSDLERPSLWYQDEEESFVKERVEELKVDEEGMMKNPLLKPGEVFIFDADKYKEAVVTPWYRNRDQPQFFLVAEICWQLSPESAFPSATHDSFREYYKHKYRVTLTQNKQPLLDVDHTSARLNLLTPRYVNRKGVALPVSSERTRRNKRDRLDQKQILVPELCRRHPFAAPLWFATVALPCVLYRINALLIADEIRRSVANQVGVGIARLDDNFTWPPLDFGWSLAEVLSADAEKNEKKKEEDKEQRDREIREKEEKQDEVKESEADNQIVIKEKTINDILQDIHEKEDAESSFEIGTWSNDMASSIPEEEDYDEMMEPLPSNLTFCTSASGGVNWCDPIQKPKPEYSNRNYNRTFSMADSDCSYSSDFDTDDSDFDSEGSDEETDASGFCNSKNSNAAVGVRIEYKTAHEAEAVDVIETRHHTAPARDLATVTSRDVADMRQILGEGKPPAEYVARFRSSVEEHKTNILQNNKFIKTTDEIKEILPPNKINQPQPAATIDKFREIFPYTNHRLEIENHQITIDSIERNKRVLLGELKESLKEEEIKKLNLFSMVDVDIDSADYVNEKIVNVGFDSKEKYEEKLKNFKERTFTAYFKENGGKNKTFDFDFQPDLEGHPGPSPSVILQALTMSNANDGINLERLETIGDSFLKFAITAYLYCAHPTVHEGKLSHMRSKQVSNLNLYRLGRRVRLGGRMIASKFEPHDNWLPPCHTPPPDPHNPEAKEGQKAMDTQRDATGCYIPYNLITQHSIPDKSIADCVEALIGAYLVECGCRGALLFMSWLGIPVLPAHTVRTAAQQEPPHPSRARCSSSSSSSSTRSEHSSGYVGPLGARAPYVSGCGDWVQVVYGELKAPPSPLLRYIADPEGELARMLSGYEELERTLQYRFKDRSLLLQALTHASHHRNTLTDCYQRLEFLGDAILDYLITRHLFEDARRHSPGALTDLRSALVNNTIFATLAVRHGFHKYFRHMSPGLNEVLIKYVRIQEENGHSISEEHYLIQEDELEQAEDVEVPKALGDLFESVAGAIFLDSGMSLGAVWQSYVRLMGAELEAFSAAAPKSPVRELLEAEPDTAKFGKPERLADGRRVRVCVEVFGRGTFKGIGRNYRIAKGTAARCALRHLKIHRR